MSSESRVNTVRVAVGAAVFLVAIAVSIVGFLNAFPPKDYRERIPPFAGYDPTAMTQAMSVASVSREMDTVLSFGSRLQGQEGFTRTHDYIRKRFEDAGLEILEYPLKLATPRTLRREILGGDGKPLPGVDIFPFMPNHYQPAVTPDSGLAGNLLLVNDAVLTSRASFTNDIALIDAAKPPDSFGFSWPKYAQLGFKAVIVAHTNGLAGFNWEDAGLGVCSWAAVNYVRVAATPDIFAHTNETITLHVRQEWADVDDIALVGILPSDKPCKEAVMITACADACSMLPDVAPGTLGAVNLAAQLSILNGITSYTNAGFKRDVIFVSHGSQMMGLLSADRLSALLGPATKKDDALRRLEADNAANDEATAHVKAAWDCFQSPEFFTDAEATRRVLDALPAGDRAVLEEQVRYVLNCLIFDISEKQLQAKLAFMRTGEKDLKSPEFLAYRKAKRDYDDAMSAAGYPVPKLIVKQKGFVDANDVRRLCDVRFRELMEHHAWKTRNLKQGLAIHKALARYDRIIPFSSFLMPADPAKTKGETVSYTMGGGVEDLSYLQYPAIHELVQSLAQSMNLPADVKAEILQTRGHGQRVTQNTASFPFDIAHWSAKGHPGFVLANTDRAYAYGQIGSPVERPFMRDLGTMASSLQLAGRCALSLAFGDGKFETPAKVSLGHYGGRVFVANVGKSIIPNHPLKHALLGHKNGNGPWDRRGYYVHPFQFTDAYGRYELPFCTAAMSSPQTYSPEAAGFGPDGLINLIKDEGGQGQSIYKSMNIGWGANRSDINIVVFRACPVTLFDLINPQSLKTYTGWGFLTRDGLGPLPKFNVFGAESGMVEAFLEPDRWFYVTLKAGTPGNDLIQTTRAFMLGVDDDFTPRPEKEIDGRGYLVADTPFLLDIPHQVASSMIMLNEKRLDLQTKYDMADERTRTFHERSKRLVKNSGEPGLAKHASVLEQRDAVTYTTLNHPVLRESISEAVWGIIWYLGLLVPFAFFFEKLVFGFADIRQQLAAQSIIFLVAFLLLRLLHPAFEMIASSAMILLGFVILLISTGITILFSGKFEENLESLKKKRGRVTAAEINTLGVMGTAFALGLNNMHRRIVRTGLTCATLVLITFAMICFTSVQSNIVNQSIAIGKAPYQGLLIKREKMAAISDGELFALQTKYGYKYDLSRRNMAIGALGWDQIRRNPDFTVAYEPADTNEVPKKQPVASLMGFDANEPLQGRIRLLTKRGWFTKEAILAGSRNGSYPVMLPDTMADKLGITPESVDQTNIMVKLNGVAVPVYGIFTSESLSNLRDLDNRDLLPFDIEAMRTMELSGNMILATEADPRFNAEKIVIVPAQWPTWDGWRRTSVVISMPDLAYRQAKEEIDQYLEQSGTAAYYGLDTVAYRGKRARENSLAGMLDLIIPLIIAAMTVLNTMRGSVYERKDEIFVYNAVGIAPKYIFAMFFSEAFVYAVVGSVLGFLLSQGVGRILTVLGLTGGLPMTFTSINTIYASIVIMAAVFFSTLFPARQAMAMAMPADDLGWKLPEPEGDRMTFALPFTFDSRGRIAVLAFFSRYLEDHGEGSSGRFFAGPPTAQVGAQTDALADGAYIPELEGTIWLKPFDLGVSQRLTISLPTDPETHEYIARITLHRLSGTRESWTRLNQPFITLLRQHFLYWRAVTATEREGMFHEARELLERNVARQETTHV